MHGLHLIADLSGCRADADTMTDARRVRALVRDAVAAAGLTPVGDAVHRFAGGGVTAAVLLAESHVALHTWPELGAATVDVYVCNFGADNSARARALMAALVAAFSPQGVSAHEVVRGDAGPRRR